MRVLGWCVLLTVSARWHLARFLLLPLGWDAVCLEVRWQQSAPNQLWPKKRSSTFHVKQSFHSQKLPRAAVRSSQSSWERETALHPLSDVSLLCRKSYQFNAPGQSTSAPFPVSKGKRKGGGRREKNLGQWGGAGLPNTHQKHFPPYFFSFCITDFEQEKILKIHFVHNKRSCIIETNSGMTRTNIFSNLVCNIFYA